MVQNLFQGTTLRVGNGLVSSILGHCSSASSYTTSTLKHVNGNLDVGLKRHKNKGAVAQPARDARPT